MCTVAAGLMGASFAINAAQGVAKYGAAQQDAAAAAAMQKQQDYAAEVDRNLKWNALATRQLQEGEAASQSLFDNQIRAVKARATAENQASDSGVYGNSVDAIARDLYEQQSRIDDATLRNTKAKVNQLQDEKQSVESEFVSRSTHAPIRSPSMLDLGLSIAGAGVNAYTTYKRATDPPTK